MARLLKCKVCGGQVASNAESCPQCGTPDYISEFDTGIAEEFTVIWKFPQTIGVRTRIALRSSENLFGEPWKNVRDHLGSSCYVDGRTSGTLQWKIKLRPGFYSFYVSTDETLGVSVDGVSGPYRITSCSVDRVRIDAAGDKTIYVEVSLIQECDEVIYDATIYSSIKTLRPAYTIHVRCGNQVREYKPNVVKKIKVEFVPKGTDGFGNRWGRRPTFFIDNECLYGREHYIALKPGQHFAGVSFGGNNTPDSTEIFVITENTKRVNITFTPSFWRSYKYVIRSIDVRE